MLGDIEKSMRLWPVDGSPERRRILDRVMAIFDGLQHARWEAFVEGDTARSDGYCAYIQNMGMVPRRKR